MGRGEERIKRTSKLFKKKIWKDFKDTEWMVKKKKKSKIQENMYNEPPLM